MDVKWLSEDEQTVWRRLLGVQQLLEERLDQELREAHGLTLAEYGVLVHLSEAGPDGLRMSDLAERLLLSRSGLTRRFDGLVRAGLVERRSCPADGRGAMALLTRRGADRLAEAAPTHITGVRRYLIDPLEGRLGALSSGLEQVETALGGARPAEGTCGQREGAARAEPAAVAT
jgi:DNA-binding MarR family transcriptional regulator